MHGSYGKKSGRGGNIMHELTQITTQIIDDALLNLHHNLSQTQRGSADQSINSRRDSTAGRYIYIRSIDAQSIYLATHPSSPPATCVVVLCDSNVKLWLL
jgi:hypothetical protein